MYVLHRTSLTSRWNGKAATLIDPFTNRRVEYRWQPLDMLLYTYFIDSEGELQDVSISSERRNPIPMLWLQSPYRSEEFVELVDIDTKIC